MLEIRESTDVSIIQSSGGSEGRKNFAKRVKEWKTCVCVCGCVEEQRILWGV